MKINKQYYKIINSINKRIIVLSDIHYYSKKDIKRLYEILKNVSILKPNYICIPGDLIDERFIHDEKLLLKWLKDLSKISLVIISIGNHEFIHKKNYETYNKELFKKINKFDNIYVLDNKLKIIDNINFIGITLPGEYYYKYKEKNKIYLINFINNYLPFVNNNYTVLLCHTPIELINSKVYDKLNSRNKINLILSGHTHGAITPNILKNRLKGRGIINPHKKIFTKYNYGKYKLNNTDFIISSGVTKASHKNMFSFLNIFFSPEITVIDIKE